MENPDITNKTARSGTARAADKLFRTFEAMIKDGTIKEGDTLPAEREIVHRFGVSRTVVREAVLALANKGLVEAKPRYRPVVKKPSYETAMQTVESVVAQLLNIPGGVKNLFETRIMIEAILVRQAALEADKNDIAALKVALEANRLSINDSEAFYRTDMMFHAVFYEISKNPLLPAIHNAYSTWLAPHWSGMPRLIDRNQQNYSAHSAIYEAILSRDPDVAEAALRDHLANAWRQVRETFGDI